MEEDVEEADAKRWTWGRRPPLEISAPEQVPGTAGDFAGDGWNLGRVVQGDQVAEGRPPAQGPGVRRPSYRWSSHPRPR